MKASQPRVKFHVAMKASDGQVEDIGFFIMDIRNVFDEEHVEEVKIMNMHPSGAFVVIGSQLVEKKSHLTALMTSQDLLRASAESMSSVLVVPSRYDPTGGTSARHCITVQLRSFRNLDKIFEQETASSFWFCWSVLDMTIQSAVYNTKAPQHVPSSEDRVHVECSTDALWNLLADMQSVRVFMCCPGKILRVAEVPLLSCSFRGDFPYSTSGWSILQPLADDRASDPHESSLPAVYAAIEVAPAAAYQRQRPPSPLGKQSASTKGLVEENNDDDDDCYDEEEFEADPPPPSPPPEEEPLGTNTPQAAPMRDPGAMDEGESVYDAKHYRLCIQVKTVKALTRAAHVSVQFSYPHLGISSSPVRTHGVWTTAHSECAVEGGVASFDFGMIPAQLRGILMEKKLVVQLLSRSQLGVEPLGDATVDLETLYLSRATFAYRCPLTGKQFRSLENFNRHRQKMIALFSMGRVGRVPPQTPVIIRSVDMYVPVMKAEEGGGGRLTTAGQVRVVLVLEDMGVTGSTSSDAFRSRRGEDALQHMRASEGGPAGAGVYAGSTAWGSSRVTVPPPPAESTDNVMTHSEEEDIIRRLEWEEWRRETEEKWMAALREKEARLKQQLEEESALKLSQRADDLKRAQEEVGRLEVRLRASIDAVERQKAQLELKEEQMNIRLAQKTEELQLLQRKVREEAKAKIDVEARRAMALESQVSLLQDNFTRMEKRALEAERDYETYRTHVRAMPETSLREEGSRLKAQVAELRGEVERERRLRAEVEMEKEHYRSQMHRIAVALKREREKSSAVARQDLEQLRLEFLAREERYMLDGDRDELRSIRDELSYLRLAGQSPQGRHDGSATTLAHGRGKASAALIAPKNASNHLSGVKGGDGNGVSSAEKIARLHALKTELLESKLYDPSDSVIEEIDNCIVQEQIIIAEMQPYSHGKLEVK